MQNTFVEGFRLSPQQHHVCALLQAENRHETQDRRRGRALRHWFARSQQSSPYQIHYAVQLEGLLDISRLCNALVRLVERHEILRTSFPHQSGSLLPVQMVNADLSLPLDILDYSWLAPRAQEEALRQLREDQRHSHSSQGQALWSQDGPLWQVTLVLCDVKRSWLLWDLSALIADAQTCYLLLHELSQLYETEGVGEEELEQPLQYADLAEWQHELLESDETAAGRAYWRFLEEAELFAVSLPYERHVDHFMPFTPSSLAIRLSPVEKAQLEKVAQELEVTSSTVLLACWGVVLSRLSTQTDVFIGTRVSGRRYKEVADVAGPLAKSLPLRYQFPAEVQISLVVRQIAVTMREADEWQEYFGWQLATPQRLQDQEYEPFCPLGFSHQTLPSPWPTGSFQWTVEEQEECLGRFKLSLSCLESAHGIQVRLHFDRQRFANEDVQRLLSHWQTVLHQVLANFYMALRALQLLSYEEKHRQLQEWNATEHNYPQDECLHQLFEQQVDQTPEAVALVFEDDVVCGFTPHLTGFTSHVTYQKLNAQANQLAYHLLGDGVGPEVLVGVCMERSLEMVVAVLAVLKAGGAYVPLDPKLPQERLTFMLEAAQIPLVLVQAHLRDYIGQVLLSTSKAIYVEPEVSSSSPEYTGNPNSGVQPENLAYLLYTSGSTGKPKGVMVTHQSISNNIRWKQSVFQLKLGDSMIQRAALSFDVSVTELFLPLTTGARVILAHPAGHKDSAYLLSLMLEQQVTILNLVPSLLRAMMEEPGFEQCLSLRHMLCGAEAFPAELQERFFACSYAELCNLYGPTEATIEVTRWVCERESMQDTVPIGRPIANTQIYLLDRNLQPVPIGVAGELYIGGRALARGYVKRPDLTAERFIANPFGGIQGARLYRTGDLARYRADGAIEYLGRVDTQQIKLRGFRIELGEMEATLQAHPAVREAVVVLREESEIKKYLVAYVVGTRASEAEVNSNTVQIRSEMDGGDGQTRVGQRPPTLTRGPDGSCRGRGGGVEGWGSLTDPEGWGLSEATLREYLLEQLPDYMVPARILFLETLPLTPNGKVDRKALLEMRDLAGQDLRLRQNETSVALSVGINSTIEASSMATALQGLLVSIWKEVFHLPNVGIHDNFFELGGHSLLATRVAWRLRQALQVDVTLPSPLQAPTIAQLSRHLEELIRNTPSALVSPVGLTQGQRKIPDRGKFSPSLQPIERPSALPLSFAQQRLWFLNQWEPHSAWYNVPMALRLSGLLQVSALEQSLAKVVQRHEVLRTIIEERAGRPVQVIFPQLCIQIPMIDLRGWPTAQRDQQVECLAHAEALRPFNLSIGPLLRMYLLQLDEREYVLLCTLHHIVCDAWSMEVLVREMTTFYRAEINEEPVGRGFTPLRLPALPIQYADYALWQREFLQGEVLDVQMAYWREQLADLSPLKLPTDHPRPAIKTDRGASQSRLLPQALSEELLRLCQHHDVTLFMLLLSSFQVLLMRYTGQTDISVGTPIANRSHAELEGMIGFFVNTLVMRTNLSGNPPFVEVLSRVREVCLRAYIHQDIPFEKVVEELEPARDLSRSPLFQVMFAMQNALGEVQTGASPIPLSGIGNLGKGDKDVGTGVSLATHTPSPTEKPLSAPAHHPLPVPTDRPGRYSDPKNLPPKGPVPLVPIITPLTVPTGTTSKFDMTLYVTEIASGVGSRELRCVLEYSTDLFEAPTITRWLNHWQTLLQGIVDNPQARLSDLPLLDVDEREQLLVEWNATKMEYPQEWCVHQLIEQQVEQTPDSVALVFEQVACRSTSHVTYAELNRRANRLAHRLQQQGVGPEALVGICLERSIEMVIALLAVLKAGGAYVPLDPGHPWERLAYMLEDAQVAVVLTQSHLHERLRAKSVTIITVDVDLAGQEHNPANVILPDQLAYLIYTSGSTGKPKGVQIPHRALFNFLQEMKRQPGLESGDALLAVTGLSFDIAGLELFLPLLTGARLVVASREVSMDAGQLARALSEHGTTIMQATPSLWRMLLDAGWRFESSMKVLCGGEVLPRDLANQLLDRGEGVWNLYGPTETTIWSTLYPVTSVENLLPIGGPIANTQIYLLDSNLQPVPIGVPGELYIGGEGLARGYWRRPDLTAERFVPNPFAGADRARPSPGPYGEPGERFYRTGDLGRYRADGAIEYLGRTDQQVKLRGFRIELGEIEAILQTHPAVREAVVILYEEERVGRYLAAYVAKASLPLEGQGSDQPPTQGELQSYLRRQLPDYMMPTVIVFLESWPLTLNGKVNRKALPVPARLVQSSVGYVAPQSEIEQRISGIWQQVLGLQTRVGIYDNFFDLGGHSLLLIEVRSKLGGLLGYEVPVVDLFQYPTIHALAAHLSERSESHVLQPITERVQKRKEALQNAKRIRESNER